MNCSLNDVGAIWGSIIGIIKGDIRSLDYSSYRV